jgi:hypothetical protein
MYDLETRRKSHNHMRMKTIIATTIRKKRKWAALSQSLGSRRTSTVTTTGP